MEGFGFLFPFLIALLVIPVVFALAISDKKKWNQIFAETARDYALSFSKGGLLQHPEISGSLEGFHVNIMRINISHGKSSTPAVKFMISLFALPGGLEIRPEGMLSRLSKKLGMTDIELGDRPFDDAAIVVGVNHHEARAILHPDARHMIVTLIQNAYGKRFLIANGAMEITRTASTFSDKASIARELQYLIRLGRLLSREGTLIELLRQNYSSDANVASRILYLESLGVLSSHLEVDDELIAYALRSAYPEEQFQAVRVIGKSAFGFLPNILKSARAELTRKIADYLTAQKPVELLPAIISVASLTLEVEKKSILVQFLGSQGDARAQDFLKDELAGAKERPVAYVKECIQALGQCGTVEAIKYLHDLTQKRFHKEVEGAIEAIKKRHGIEDSGWLSLQKPEAGEGNLSLSDE